ncbi:hypothetical protein [Spirosoma gilvum]
MARPREYKPDYHPEQAKELCLLGYTNKELASTFNVSERTINYWLNQHEEFFQAVQEGRDLADAKVAVSFFKRATGYEYPSEKIVTISIGDGCSQVERVPVTAVVLPDAGAALNWLKNRQPDKWRDKVDVELPPKIVLTMHLDGDPNSSQQS